MSTDAYLDARAEFERRNAEVMAIARTLSHAAAALARQPGRFIFSNCAIGLPIGASTSRAVSVNANDWRTPDEIQAILAKWHEARSAMLNAWSNLPDDRRRGLLPPPETS